MERLSLRVAVVPRGIVDGALDHVELVVGGASVAVEAVAATNLIENAKWRAELGKRPFPAIKVYFVNSGMK